MRTHPAHEPLELEALVRGGDITSVELEVCDVRGQVLASSGPLALNYGRGTWSWRPNDDAGAQTLRDDEDQLIVAPRVRVEAKGEEHVEALERVRILRDRVELSLSTPAGEAVRDASVRLLAHGPGGVDKLGPLTADASGKLCFSGLRDWDRLDPRVDSPWVLADPDAPWAAGKDVGLARELVVEPKRYDAAILGIRSDPGQAFVELGELGGERRQYVNCERFDPGQDLPAPGEDASHFGHRVELCVGPAREPATMAGEVIHLELRAHADNAEHPGQGRPPPGLDGADARGITTLELDEDGRAICAVELGTVGGDRFELRVSSTGKFGPAADVELELVNWRRLYVELSLPRALGAALEPVKLPSAAGPGPHYDVPAEVREALDARLAPVFIAWTPGPTQLEADDAAVLVDAGALERADGRPLRLGHPHGGAAPASKRGSRTLGLALFDLYFAARVSSTRQRAELSGPTHSLSPSAEGRLFAPELEALAGVVDPPPTWSAVLGPEAPAAHPGRGADGQPRHGTLAAKQLRWRSATALELELPADGPDDPGSFVGPASERTCPIRVAVSAAELSPEPECLAGAGVLVLDPRPELVAHRLCHLLAHALGVPPLGRRVPAGLEPPADVDAGGPYFRGPGRGASYRSPGRGIHCADGVADPSAQDLGPTIPAAGCIMYAREPAPDAASIDHEFCSHCAAYLRALPARFEP